MSDVTVGTAGVVTETTRCVVTLAAFVALIVNGVAAKYAY
jgi:hypothetical protein